MSEKQADSGADCTRILVRILDPRIGTLFPLPKRATEGSAAVDLRAMVEEAQILPPQSRLLIPTGLAICIADPSKAGLIVPRSGLGHAQGIVLGNSVGLIDSDYQGPLQVSCWNTGTQDFCIEPGMRIAQLLIIPICPIAFEPVAVFPEATQRGQGGFGHSGVQ